MKHYYKNVFFVALFIMFIGVNSNTVKAQLLINEGFTTVLPTGWLSQNLSSPLGSTTWGQGNGTTLVAYSGPANSYAFANFNSVAGANTISNWLFTPQVALTNGNVISFYTRVPTGGGAFPDRLELRMSTNGASVNAGTTNASVGDFTTLLLSVNPNLTTTGYPEVWTKFSATISGLPAPTTGRFAFRYFVTDGGSGSNSNYIGIDEVQYGVPCSGTPAPGNTVPSVTTVCPLVPFNLSLQNATNGTGVTYLWQSAPAATGPWTNIPNGSNATLTTTQSAANFYRAVVTCGANSGTSTPVQVLLSTCYCTAGATSTAFEKISRVVFGSINNPSTSTAGYENFTALTTNAYIGSTMPITVTLAGGFAADQVRVWIDFNKDLDFDDAGELVYTSANGAGPHTGSIVIPATVTTGTTRMRVRMHDTSLGANGTPCGTSTYGQVEDYTLNLVPCVPVTVTTQAANATVTCGANTSFTVALAGSDSSAYWQYRTSATSTNWLDVPNSAPYSGINTTTLSITGATAALNAYQYRVVYRGACTGASFSNAATLTVNPLVAVVSPASASICLGSIQQLSLTNIVSAAQTATFTATGLPVAIPDGPFPVTTTAVIPITVSGIPAGSVIQNVGIRFSITHPYVGDLVMNLKAPNNQTLNMFALLNNATGTNATANFTNTTIDSVSTAAISGAPAPRSGSYRAEKYAITNPDFGSLVVTNTSWAALLGTLNGTWSINVGDLGAPDAGSVTAMSLVITYTAPNFAQGTWTGRPGTIFTDAAATTAYTGTPASTVYVKPDTLGVVNYSVSFATSGCQSTVATVPVTVRQLPTSLPAVANKVICQGGNTTFTAATPATGSGFATQWQVSTDGGVTFTDITNGTVYGGATTGTLTLTAAPVSYNNYRYRLSVTAAPCVGSINSNAAILTVNPTPVVVLSANPGTDIYPGVTSTLSVAVSPNAAATYTWFKNGVIVPGATGNSLVVDVDAAGTYTVSVNDVNGCNKTSNAITIKGVANDILFIYPSPNTGQFQVRYFSEFGNTVYPRMVNVYDSKGTRVYSRSYSINSPYTRIDVNLSNHPKGIYTVELSDNNGDRIKTGRVVIL